VLRHHPDHDHLADTVTASVRRRWIAACACVLLLFAGAPAALATPGPADAPEWWFDKWGVPALWAAGADGRGITIAEIDSGVNASLSALSGKILPGTDFGTQGGDGRTDRETDPFGHGTAMASIMVASPTIFGIEGLAPAAKILPVAIPLLGTSDANGNDHLADAITWAADHGAKIINMSLGANRDQQTDPLACPSDEQAAVYQALAKGDIVVAAAGNNGPSPTDIEEPSVCIGVITVGAIDSTGAVASFSSRTPKLTVTAPGVNIPSLGRIAGQAYQGKGTSQASALTSAALALIWSKFPTLTNRQVVARLLATLDNKQASADPASGYGAINPGAAINTNVAADAPNPVFDVAAPFIAQLTKPASAATPAAAVTAPAPPGHYEAAAPPSDVTAEVKIGTGIALAGLICLLLLAIFGVRGRRRHPVAEPYLPPLGGYVAGPIGASRSPGDPAARWHDVFEPPAWAAPTTPPVWSAPVGEPLVAYPPPTLAQVRPPQPEWSPPTHTTVGSDGSPHAGDPVDPAQNGPQ
jgi:subtilisin family serine protease